MLKKLKMERRLAVVIALLCLELSAAVPLSGPGEPVKAAEARMRRNAGAQNMTSSASMLVEYMKSVLTTITDEKGKPKYGEWDPTAVWGFLDRGE